MSQEIEEYLELKNKLYAVIDNINIALDIHNTLINELTENISIDTKCPQEEQLVENIESLKEIKRELKSIIYKEINSKL